MPPLKCWCENSKCRENNDSKKIDLDLLFGSTDKSQPNIEKNNSNKINHLNLNRKSG